MKLLGIEFDVKNVPVLDTGFIPVTLFNRAFLKLATVPIAIAVQRNDNQVSVTKTKICADSALVDANKFYIERLLKSLLWVKGGYKITIFCDDTTIVDYIKTLYSDNGKRSFDYKFMAKVYEESFVVEGMPYNNIISSNETSKPIGRNLDGCRIGFDAGGSDRKVSAVIDGEPVFSEEVVWFPKTNPDPEYHYAGIVEAMKKAASYMPRVDAIGVSSAGIYVDNRAMAASLFLKVPEDVFNAKVKDIYINAAKEIGDVPLAVANDGDVTALAGAMSLDSDSVLGIAMGTSEAVGYIDHQGNINGWLNELAFVPVDFQPDALLDEWSGDIGCGVKYFSQDSVIKLAPRIGIAFGDDMSPGDKLKKVQDLMKTDVNVEKIFSTIGCYLGHTMAYYSDYYDIKYTLLMGRVVSGVGGDIVLKVANDVLKDEYPELKVKVQLPDEKSRRIGQSVAAASLPRITK